MASLLYDDNDNVISMNDCSRCNVNVLPSKNKRDKDAHGWKGISNTVISWGLCGPNVASSQRKARMWPSDCTRMHTKAPHGCSWYRQTPTIEYLSWTGGGTIVGQMTDKISQYSWSGGYCWDLFAVICSRKVLSKSYLFLTTGGGWLAGQSLLRIEIHRGKWNYWSFVHNNTVFLKKPVSHPPPSLKKTYGQSGLVSHVPRERYWMLFPTCSTPWFQCCPSDGIFLFYSLQLGGKKDWIMHTPWTYINHPSVAPFSHRRNRRRSCFWSR